MRMARFSGCFYLLVVWCGLMVCFFSVMNFVGYQYQKERERELMGEWLEVGGGGDGGTGDLEER